MVGVLEKAQPLVIRGTHYGSQLWDPHIALTFPSPFVYTASDRCVLPFLLIAVHEMAASSISLNVWDLQLERFRSSKHQDRLFLLVDGSMPK